MKRVVVKCRLKDAAEFEQKLKDIEMSFGATFWMHDRVYVPRNYQKGNSHPRLTLRTVVRSVDQTPSYELILRRHIEDSGVDIVDATPILDYGEAANIIMQLGFRQQAEVSSKRKEIVMNAGTRLSVDAVEGVAGLFAKLETTLEEGDKVEDVRRDLKKTFRVLGQTDIVEAAYSDLLHRL